MPPSYLWGLVSLSKATFEKRNCFFNNHLVFIREAPHYLVLLLNLWNFISCCQQIQSCGIIYYADMCKLLRLDKHSFFHLHSQLAKHVELTLKLWRQLTTNHRSKIKMFVTWTFDIKMLTVASNWCCTTFCFNQNLFVPVVISQTYSWHHIDLALMSIYYFQFDISSIVPWYWPNYDNLRFILENNIR